MPITLSQLQKKLGCSKGTVRNRLVRMAIEPGAQMPRQGSEEYMAALDSVAKKVGGDKKGTRVVSRMVAETLLAEYQRSEPDPEYVADEQTSTLALSKRDIAEAVAGGVGSQLDALGDSLDGRLNGLEEKLENLRQEQIKEAEDRGRRQGFADGFREGAQSEFDEIKRKSGFRARSNYIKGDGPSEKSLDRRCSDVLRKYTSDGRRKG